jgi:hypothetical protein
MRRLIPRHKITGTCRLCKLLLTEEEGKSMTGSDPAFTAKAPFVVAGSIRRSSQMHKDTYSLDAQQRALIEEGRKRYLQEGTRFPFSQLFILCDTGLQSCTEGLHFLDLHTSFTSHREVPFPLGNAYHHTNSACTDQGVPLIPYLTSLKAQHAQYFRDFLGKLEDLIRASQRVDNPIVF